MKTGTTKHFAVRGRLLKVVGLNLEKGKTIHISIRSRISGGALLHRYKHACGECPRLRRSDLSPSVGQNGGSKTGFLAKKLADAG